MTDIPLATILRINAARTIPLTRYEEEGNFDRFGYIKDLAENHGADLPAVIEIADLLGPVGPKLRFWPSRRTFWERGIRY